MGEALLGGSEYPMSRSFNFLHNFPVFRYFFFCLFLHIPYPENLSVKLKSCVVFEVPPKAENAIILECEMKY